MKELRRMNAWRRRGRPLRPRPTLERLESRTLFAGHTLATAALVTPGPLGTAEVPGWIAAPLEADLFRVHLDAGDRLRIAVSAQGAGSGLQSVLRVFARG